MTNKTFNYRLSILNFIDPPGFLRISKHQNLRTPETNSFIGYNKKAFMSCFLQAWKLFFIDNSQQTIDYRLCPHCLVSEPVKVTSCLRQAQASHTQGLLTVVRCPLT